MYIYILSQTSNETLTSLVNISCIFINLSLNVPMTFYQQIKVIFSIK